MSRILMTMIRPQSYGASRMAMHYALALTKAGHEVIVAYAVRVEDSMEQNSILPELRAGGVESLHVEGLARFGLPRTLTPLFTAARSLRPDVIISNNVRDAPAAMQTARRLNVPGIVFAQVLPRFGGLPGIRHLKTWLYRYTLRRNATHVVCVAPGVAKDLIENGGLDAASASVVLNGICLGNGNPDRSRIRREMRDELGLTDELVLLNLARIHPQKGQKTLLEAIHVLSQRPDVPKFVLLIAGDAESRAELRLKLELHAFVRQHQLQDCVRFLGFRTDGDRLLRAADVFVLPSLWEGLPLAVLEAFAAECPVIMTEYSEKFDKFRDDVDGVYVPPGDSFALADAIGRLATVSEVDRCEMGRNGRHYLLQHLSLEKAQDLFRRCVEKVLKEPVNRGKGGAYTEVIPSDIV